MSRPQTFANHRSLPTSFWLLVAAVLLAEAGRRAWLAVSAPSLEHAWIAIVAFALFCAFYQARRLAQIVQDRVIRLEMKLRLDSVLGPARRADVARLSLPQVVALRFASDGELPALVDDVLAGKLARPNEIKRRVRDWQADWLRV